MNIWPACPTHGMDGAVRLSDGDILRCGEGDPECGLPMVQEPTPAEKIVRELAERGPFTKPVDDACVGCGVLWAFQDDDPSRHDPSCIWRRAREMYPKESA